MVAILRSLPSALLLCWCLQAHGETLRIVTDSWAPYAYEENGSAQGIDYDITALIFERLGIQVQWQFLPWKRCLAMLDQGQADGILDIFQTNERDASLFYAREPLSQVQWVFYQANSRPHPVHSMADLKGLTVGITAGYDYGDEFDQAQGVTRESGPSQEANFGKLAKARIDLLITDRRVGEYTVKRLGLEQRVSPLPLEIGSNPQFLAVRRGAGMDLLVQRFAAELRRFKQEPAYEQLLARYADAPMSGKTIPSAAPPNLQQPPAGTAGQRESSAM
jgi:polar amino acid transport system substrate-binding protein